MKYLNQFHKETTEKALKYLQEQDKMPRASLEEMLKEMEETSKGTKFSREEPLDKGNEELLS